MFPNVTVIAIRYSESLSVMYLFSMPVFVEEGGERGAGAGPGSGGLRGLPGGRPAKKRKRKQKRKM